jgi:hydrogenase maturation protein HypF
MARRTQILVRGIVQGVGFRPFVFSLARRRALKGQVRNSTAGVLIDVEGEDCSIEQFVRELQSNPPPLSTIDSVVCTSDLTPAHFLDFHIVESISEKDNYTPISADVATCEDCLRELFDPRDRRYLYPFINCTNCGPRFTIVEDIPYDRSRTTMREFRMCVACKAEYENPLDRRFHAEPVACRECGPRLQLTDSHGCELPLAMPGTHEVFNRTCHLLANGEIIAIKGIGGFHLACDALNSAAVERLRQRKFREEKPFAIMANSVAEIKRFCLVSQAEEALLLSPQRPIVLLERQVVSAVPPAVAPGVNTLGFMLPYSPLHHLLLNQFERPLVMTSGNISDEPICYENEQALERLKEIADYFLLHDRRIHIRSDDSVARACESNEMIVRRSRGYAPAPIKTSFRFEREILACGAELKNTFCLARDHHAFISHHIGDLENLETLRSFTEGIEHFKRLFHLRPESVAYDLHPEYLSTKYALSLDAQGPKIGVQHHHAHVASCMADNGIEGEVIGVAMDGLGFGTDGRLWGGEFFVADLCEAERVGHLEYIPMPGGAKAIREPWRMAAIYLQRAVGDSFPALNLPYTINMDRRAWHVLKRMAEQGVNSPDTSSVGRLFDAVSSLVGLRHVTNYEGQAAIELEAIADKSVTQGYAFEIGTDGVIKAESIIRLIVEELVDGVSPSKVSARLHLGIASLIRSMAQRVREKRQLNRVVLSGGVFQNMFLVRASCRMLRADGFEVFTHRRVPPNDGGISLGQAAIANARLASGRA